METVSAEVLYKNNKMDVISCICVTRGKPLMLKRAISCFTAQSYPFKELIIVYEDDDVGTVEMLKELRNIGIKASNGEFICQWDDDDWYHENRLTLQYTISMENNYKGSVMTQWLVYNTIDKQAFISNERVWEGSVLCKKKVLQGVPYENKSMGEDSATINSLLEKDHIYLIKSMPGLYIYIYHGSNTWNFEHWKYIFECSTALSNSDSRLIADILDGNYSVQEGSSLIDKTLQINLQKK